MKLDLSEFIDVKKVEEARTDLQAQFDALGPQIDDLTKQRADLAEKLAGLETLSALIPEQNRPARA